MGNFDVTKYPDNFFWFLPIFGHPPCLSCYPLLNLSLCVEVQVRRMQSCSVDDGSLSDQRTHQFGHSLGAIGYLERNSKITRID